MTRPVLPGAAPPSARADRSDVGGVGGGVLGRTPIGVRYAVAAAGFAVAALTVSHDELTADWFADEAWRANFVRSPRWWDLYTSWDTPTAPGFIVSFRVIGLALPTGPFALRIATLVTLVATLVLALRLMLAIAERTPAGSTGSATCGPERTDDLRQIRQRRSMQVAAVTACLVAPMLSAFGVHRIFVPYFLETTLAVALVLGCLRLDAHRAVWPALLVVVVATPLFGIGSMFLLPATAVYLLWWAYRQPLRRSRLGWTVAALGTASVEALAVYWFAYRPVATDSITRYWSASSLEGRPARFDDLVVDTVGLVRDGLVSWSHPSVVERAGTLLSLLTVACVAVGMTSLGRRWPPLVAFVLSGWVCIVLTSLVMGWPMTAERVNLPVFVFVYLAALYGAMRIVALATRQLPVLSVGAAMLAVGLLWPTDKTELFGDAFLRGVTADLAIVADSPSQHNLVVTYHFASRWYVEDRLVTSSPGGRTYDVMPETYTDLSVYDPAVLAARISALPSGAAVWCVIPFDVGPENAERACAVPSNLRPIVSRRGERSLIRGYLTP